MVNVRLRQSSSPYQAKRRGGAQGRLVAGRSTNSVAMPSHRGTLADARFLARAVVIRCARCRFLDDEGLRGADAALFLVLSTRLQIRMPKDIRICLTIAPM
jgi:hypothetical protein